MLKSENRRLDKIEQMLAHVNTAKREACICRGRGRVNTAGDRPDTTRYHTAEELEQILAVPCPVHGVRDPGFTWPAPPWLAINKEDWQFCHCPPNVRRDVEMGKIVLPDDPVAARKKFQELLDEEMDREIGCPPKSHGDFEAENAKLDAVLKAFSERFESQKDVNNPGRQSTHR